MLGEGHSLMGALLLVRVHSVGKIFFITFAKLLLQVSWGPPGFLASLIHVARNFLGRLVSLDLAALPMYFATLLSIKASTFGML